MFKVWFEGGIHISAIHGKCLLSIFVAIPEIWIMQEGRVNYDYDKNYMKLAHVSGKEVTIDLTISGPAIRTNVQLKFTKGSVPLKDTYF